MWLIARHVAHSMAFLSVIVLDIFMSSAKMDLPIEMVFGGTLVRA